MYKGFFTMRRRQEPGLLGLIALIALTVGGCGHVISETVRRQVRAEVPFSELRADPEAYKDRTVILGGELLSTRNSQEGTLLEVLQRPLNSYERPLFTDRTDGRFMVLCTQYLDAAIYAKGREITVAGRVLGLRKGQIGEMEYSYPFISCLEIHLWPEPVPQQYEPYPWWYWDPFWAPWYWWPYGYPFWRHHYPYP
jgi:outer membrane lipoprotein